MSGIYLDVAATAKNEVDDIIIDTITEAMKEYWMNPSSLYATDVAKEIGRCKANIAKFIGAEANEMYFTSGSSESNNWAIRGFSDKMWENLYDNPYVITTRIEHKSIMNAVRNESLGAIVRYCDVDEYGLVNLNKLESLLSECYDEPVLVSICMANNEIGTVQHIKMISDIVHKYNFFLHVDATQALGHIPINVEELGIDMMSCSGHKISPVLRGIGFLYKKNGINISPLIHGTQENGLRGGTENTYGIIGLSKAIDYCNINPKAIEEMSNKRDYFIHLLRLKFGCKLNGHYEYRLPNNLNVTFPQNITSEALLYTLETSEIYVSAGSACNSKSIKPSHVLKAIGLTDDEAMRTIRITLPNNITYEQIDKVINEIESAIKVITIEGSDIIV